MTYYKKLVGEKCYLSPVVNEDVGKWVEWFNDLEVVIPLGDETSLNITQQNQLESIKNFTKYSEHVFTIVESENDKPIGRCLLFNIDHINRKAMIGIAIGDKTFWNKGYGTGAMRLLLDYAFNLLNLNSIMLGVYAYNEWAIKCYEKVGFKLIGRKREARIICGKKYDVIYMDILAKEFESKYVKNFTTYLH